MTHHAYVALGSNLADPLQQVRSALAALAALPETTRIAHSSLYLSTPLGPPGQPDYVNAVCTLATRLPPERLLDRLLEIENQHGRIRGAERWGPRTLDLDLLLYGEVEMQTAHLTLPHPRLHERNFVLYPLYELAPALSIPGHGTLAELIKRCPAQGLRKQDEQT